MNLKQTALLLKAFSDETRFRILHLLSQGELCVCDVMCVLKQPQSKVSRHFAYLRKAGLVQGRKEGLWMYYRLTDSQSGILQALKQLLKASASELTELKKDASEKIQKRKTLVACCS
jgi:ArsR family transcriptional regulator, arsenate/arsenite/antimonite-responsive transcriptional repressor